jgi:uncharacterized protein with HEPN domain
MKKDPVIYLEHIQNCINRIKDYTKGVNEADFLQNLLIQDAVIRNFEIIGEASKQLSSEFKEKYPEIEWKKISGMRDKLFMIILGLIFGLFGELLKPYYRSLNYNFQKS